MSSNRDLVREAIADGARNTAAVIEATGLETKQVSNVIFQLKQASEVMVVDGSLKLADGKQAPRTNGEAGPAVVADKPKRGRPKKSDAPPPSDQTAQGEGSEAKGEQAGRTCTTRRSGRIGSGPGRFHALRRIRRSAQGGLARPGAHARAVERAR